MSSNYKVIEDNISTIKKMTLDYENMNDSEKVKNISNLYNEIVKKKEECFKLLNEYKKNLEQQLNENICGNKSDDSNKKSNGNTKTNKNVNDTNIINDLEYSESLNRINKIKKNSKLNDLNLDELIEINLQLNDDIIKVNNYLNQKKMEIINLN